MPRCNRHGISEQDELWKVSWEEIEAEKIFEEAICPVCYRELYDTLKRIRRELKVSVRQNIRCRSELSEMQDIVTGIKRVLEKELGIDVESLAGQEYKEGKGDLRKILPNLIMKIAKKEKEVL